MFAYCANNPVIYVDSSGEGVVLACVIIFAVLGAVIGGVLAAKASKEELGYVDGLWVVGGAVVGGGVGALFGYCVGYAAVAIGATTTAASTGTLGTTIYANWQSAEQALRNAYNGVKQMFSTPYGSRVLDCFTDGVAREAKYGYQSLSQFIQNEIAKDAWLLENGFVDRVEWHFYWSQASQSGGPSGPLLEALFKAGFDVIFH